MNKGELTDAKVPAIPKAKGNICKIVEDISLIKGHHLLLPEEGGNHPEHAPLKETPQGIIAGREGKGAARQLAQKGENAWHGNAGTWRKKAWKAATGAAHAQQPI
ncbi:hypothetical protein CONPUDRAFT_157406 [Coniophora puteana RWD-64-598 SS2]|uniref:Uncharacterized protein n=1 Tax=Coniophora puteana (strain RWD-64-598) TaxID=741705 RepID=A0A5M3MD23_CONPW|nr:uncharacterized protein CONPUDRAFT_157406 [Coniophora puteana RWD-64-598 SS2]EIW77139.1 hypothetical protein CONPUDRAFT_157406 [Coniophora puteana RWD-64-598 SS2]